MPEAAARPRLRFVPCFKVVLLGACLLMAGCAWTSITVPVTMAPEINMQNYPTLGVWTLSGGGRQKQGGLDITEEITQELVKSGRFEVQNSRMLEQILREQGRQIGAEFTPDMAQRLGQVIPTTAVLSGRVREYSVTQNVDREAITLPVYDTQGKRTGERNATRFTRHARATVSVAIDVTDLATAKLLTTKVTEATAEESATEIDKQPPAFDENRLLGQARRQVVEDLMKAITPWQQKRQVVLYKTSGTFAFGGGEPEFSEGIALLDRPRPDWERAGAAFLRGIQRLEQAHGANPALLARGWYNYAVALHYGAIQAKDREEALQAFADAKAAYDKTLEYRFDSDFDRARELCAADFENWKRLNPMSDASLIAP